jgi:hydroxymethylpyrimidine/phosphomethylpyrimidine kinase
MVTVMTIAGFDPSCGAGIAADIRTFCAIGVYPTSVVTCVTSQNDVKFYRNISVQADMVEDQIKAVVECYKISAVKIGMLYTKENVKAVAESIAHHGFKNVVMDPLIVSTTGEKLIDCDIGFLKNELFGHVDLLTPNVSEAEKLSQKSILDIDDRKEAAVEIATFGCKNVVITGCAEGGRCVDMLYDGGNFIEFKKDNLEIPDLHGTGCTFSSAAAAFLAKGKSMKEAVKEAKEFTYYSIKYADKLEDKARVLNPFFMKGGY